jgi:hypothetical protein
MLKPKSSFVLLGILLSIASYSQDKTATRVVQNHLDIIKAYSRAPYPYSYSDVISSSRFLEKLTKITFDQGGGYIGSNPPSKDDLQKWQIWLIVNRKYLIWDAKHQIVRLSRKILIPNF